MESVTPKEVIVAAKVFTFAGYVNDKFKRDTIMSNETMGVGFCWWRFNFTINDVDSMFFRL